MAKSKSKTKPAKKLAAKAAKPAKKAVKPAKPTKKIVVAPKKVAKVAAKTEKIKPKEKEVLAKKGKKEAPVEKAPEKLKKGKKAEVEIVAEPVAEEAEIVLTDAEGRRYCRVQDCDQIANVEAYCRYHYLLYWKKIQYRKKILADNKFHKYIDELTSKYPDKFLDVIRKDLMSQKNFLNAIQEMEIDESAEEADADDKSFIDDMRGIGSEISTTEESGDDY